jgi:hypothetical protein
MSSSDYATDGALGISSMGLNPFVTPGVIYSLAAPTVASTNLAGNLVASSNDSQVVLPNTRIAIDDAGNIYSWSGSGWTKQVTGLSNTYSFPESDIEPFYSHNYATCNGDDLLQINTSSWTVNEEFQTLQDANALHPLLVYQASLWIGDGKHLANLQSDESTFNADASWVLNGNEKIVALGIDPLTGLMMVSVENSYNPTDSIQQKGIIYLYDGISSKPSRKILVDDLITAFYNIGGQVFVGTGSGTIGAWNGNGITYLRKLATNGTFLKADLPYKHHFSNTRNILHIVDGDDVLSYGEVIAGKKAFFYTGYNSINSNNIDIIFPAGSNKLGVAAHSSQFETFDFGSTAAGLGILYFNNIYFPRPIFIRRVRVITTNITTTGGGGIGGFTFFDENSLFPTQIGFIVPSLGATSTGSPQNDFDFDYGSFKCQAVQPRLTFSGQGFGVIRIIIYYDVAE